MRWHGDQAGLVGWPDFRFWVWLFMRLVRSPLIQTDWTEAALVWLLLIEFNITARICWLLAGNLVLGQTGSIGLSSAGFPTLVLVYIWCSCVLKFECHPLIHIKLGCFHCWSCTGWFAWSSYWCDQFWTNPMQGV